MSSAIAAATGAESDLRRTDPRGLGPLPPHRALRGRWRPRRVRDLGAPPLVDRRHRSPPAVLPVLPGGVQLLAGRRVRLPGVSHAAIRHRGAWGLLLRRILEAAAGTLPLLAVLFLPVLFGLPFASKYTQWNPVQTSEESHFKAVWLSTGLRPRTGGHLLRLLDRHGPAVPRLVETAGRDGRSPHP